MPENRVPLFRDGFSLTGPQRMRILEQRERALRGAQEAAYRTTAAASSDIPVSDENVMWGKDLRRGQINIVKQLLRYIDNAAERKLVAEGRDGVEKMLAEVQRYCDLVLPAPKPTPVTSRPMFVMPDITPTFKSRGLMFSRTDETERAV